MPELPQSPRRTLMLVACWALVAIGILGFFLAEPLMDRADDGLRASVRADGITTQAVVVAKDHEVKGPVVLTIDYHIDGHTLEHPVDCSHLCEAVGAPITVTVDRNDPDRFVTADGRLYADRWHYAELSVWLALVLFAVGAAGIGYQAAVKRSASRGKR